MNLLYIADNGFSFYKGKFYCTAPNQINISQYKKYFDVVHVIARESILQNNSFEMSKESKVFLIKKYDFLSLFKAMKFNANQYDVVLMRNGINGCFAGLFAKWLKKPTIAYCGSDPFELQISKKTLISKALAPIWGYLEQNKMEKANYSQYCTEYLYKKYPTQNNHLICSNVDIEINEKNLINRIIKINNKHNYKYVIGLIGPFIKNKGANTIIQALAELGSNYSFEFIGNKGFEDFSEEIKKHNLENRISYLGYWSDKNKIKDWLGKIDIYIQPSLSEGLPRATIEAMSMACPCIATNIAGLPDLLKNQYLINPNDYVSLANKIKWLTTNKEETLKAAKENFTKAKKYDRNLRDIKLDSFFNQIVYEIKQRGNGHE